MPLSKSKVELPLLIGIYIGTFCYYHVIQPHISFEAEPLLDAHQYLKSYLYFSGNLSSYNVNFPFNHRVGVPFLASLLPFENILLNFKIVHFFMLLGSVLLFHFSWKKLNISVLLRWFFWFWYLFHWIGPIRYTMHEPISTDSANYLFTALFIWFFVTHRSIHFLWLLPLSVIFKESLIPYTFVLAGVSMLLHHDWKRTLFYLVTFGLGMVSLFFLRSTFPMSEYNWKFQAPITLLWYLNYFFLHPVENLRWVAALILSSGLIVFLFPYSKKVFKTVEFYLFVCAVLLGFLSGTDQLRILFSSIGFIMLFLLKNTTNKKLVIYAVVCSIPFMHLFSTIPDITNEQTYANWFPEHTEWNTITLLFTYCLMCYLAWKPIKKVEFTLPKWIRKKP